MKNLLIILSLLLFTGRMQAQLCTKPFTIVILGSSTAAGHGATPIDSAWAFKYSAYLKSINKNYQVFNLAVGGTTTYFAQPSDYVPPAGRPLPDTLHNITAALALQPDAVIINFASNDAVNFYSIAEQQENFKRITGILDQLNIPVWVATTQPRDNLKTYPLQSQLTMRDWITTYYQEKSIDFWNGIASPADSILEKYSYGDGTHLNNLGHDVLYRRVLASKITDSLCLRTQGICKEPTEITAHYIDAGHAVIFWKPASAESYNVQYRDSLATDWITVNTTNDSLILSSLKCGSSYAYRVQSVCSAGSFSPYATHAYFTTLDCESCGALPARYATADIGNTGKEGQACYIKPDKFNVKGSGANIYDNADAFRFAYVPVKKDGAITVKVTSLDKANEWNKAGIMLRESLAAGARNAYICITSAQGTAFQYRNATNGTTVKASYGKFTAPYFLKLVKTGTAYAGYVSADSISWKLVLSTNIPGFGENSNPIFAGLAVTSHDNTKLSTASFSNYNLTFDTSLQTDTTVTPPVDTATCGQLPANFITTDIGAVGKAGAACYFASTGIYKLQGSGTNIFDNADGFRFAYSPFAGDGTVEAKVTGMDNINEWNKAGVMFRASLAAGAANVYMCITSAQGSAFQYRATTGGATVKVSLGTYKAPYFVRLVKTGTTYAGYVSADSLTWRLVKSINIPGLGDQLFAGLAVTSHDNTKLSTAVFNRFKTYNTSMALLNTSTYITPLNTLADEGLHLNVYPNPSSANFVVDFTISRPQNLMLAITGLGDGRIYHTESFAKFSGNYHKNFNRFNLPKGAYIISIKTKDYLKSIYFIKQ